MNGVRRSTRLSSVSKADPLPTQHSEIWRQRESKVYDVSDCEVECVTDSENNENYNLINSSTKKRLPIPKTSEMKTPKTPKGLRPMPASKKRDVLTKFKQQQVLSKNKTSSDDEPSLKDEHGSPPKQRRTDKQLSSVHLISPSRLLDRLSIEDKADTEAEEDTRGDPTSTPKSSPKRNKYQNARRVLNSAETNFLPGREGELKELQDFLTDHLDKEQAGSLYVSGQPGTGKTACLSKLLKSAEFSSQFIKVYINCTSISSVGSIFKKICTEMHLKVQGRTEKDHLAAIRKHLCVKQQNRKMVLIVLDEIDQLCSQKQSVLYTIFEWPALPGSRLLLIGIANSLDLTDRLLTRLNAKCDLKPRLLHFPPYTKQQIIEIFKSRLEEAGVQDVFPPVTLQLLAAKVSAVSGDVRRALDIGRRVVEIAEQQRATGAGQAKLNLNDLGLENSEAEELKPVQVTQVMSVLNNVYGASQQLHLDIEDAFPLQQKIMLCCLMLMLRKEKNKDITLGRLHDVYKRVCKKRHILSVDQAEFVGLIDLVETRGILRIMRKKEPRLSKVQLQWDEEEVNAALCDKQLISSILDDTSCLVR